MDAVHAALSHCPNITALDLRVTGLGCSDWPERWDFPLHPWGGETYANLTSLRLEGYKFSGPGETYRFPYVNEQQSIFSQWLYKLMSAVRLELTEQGFLRPVPNKTHLDLFTDALDVSLLQHLSLDPITDEMLTKLPPKLSSLTSLESTNSSFICALAPNTLTNLTSVSYRLPSTDLPSILSIHGPTLKHLDLRTPERAREPFEADFDAGILPALAPNLVNISLNVPRNGTWPLETLSTLASLHNLTSVHIYTGIQSECAQQRPMQYTSAWIEWRERVGEVCMHEEQFQKPWVDREVGEELFAYLRREKNGTELRDLTIWVGDWTRRHDGPLYDPDWLEGKRAKVVCRAKGDEGNMCVVEEGEGYWLRDHWWAHWG
jgi:hypothetical protein